MRRHMGLLLPALVVLLASSCFQYAVQPMPLSEAARRPADSLRVAAGLHGGTGMLYSLYGVATWEHGAFSEVRCDRFAAGQGFVTLEGGKDRLKGIFSLGLGLAQMTDTFWQPNGSFRGNPAGVSRLAFPLHLSSGCKIAVGNEGAIRLSLGTDFCFFEPDTAVKEPLFPLPSADVFLLRDIGLRWTAGMGLGLRGLQLNAVHHLRLRKGAEGDVAFNLLYHGLPVQWASREPRIGLPIAVKVGLALSSYR